MNNKFFSIFISCLIFAMGASFIGCPGTGNDIGNETFVSSTNNTTANDIATLGIIGTEVSSSNTNIATAVISNEKISITSIAEGSAVITIKDNSNHVATIDITVSKTGSISIKNVNKYSDTNPFEGTWYNNADSSIPMPANMAKVVIEGNSFIEYLDTPPTDEWINLMKGSFEKISDTKASVTITHGYAGGEWSTDFTKTLDATSETIDSMLNGQTTFTFTITENVMSSTINTTTFHKNENDDPPNFTLINIDTTKQSEGSTWFIFGLFPTGTSSATVLADAKAHKNSTIPTAVVAYAGGASNTLPWGGTPGNLSISSTLTSASDHSSIWKGSGPYDSWVLVCSGSTWNGYKLAINVQGNVTKSANDFSKTIINQN